MVAHLQEAAVELAFLAQEHRINRCGHVVVNPARADAAEEGERPCMGVEHHLLRLAGVGTHEEHPAMAQPHMRDLHRRRHAGQHHDLMAPVELVSLARLKAQRHERGRRAAHFLALPAAGMAANGIIAALVSLRPQRLEQADQRQSLAPRLAFVLRQSPLKLGHVGTQLGHRLNRAIVAELAVLGLDRLPDRLPRNMQPPRDLPHRLTLHEIRTPDPSNRLHRRHPPPRRLPQSQATIDDPGVVPD